MLSYSSHGNCNSASYGKAQRLSPYTITEDAEHMQSDQITVVADNQVFELPCRQNLRHLLGF